MINIMETEGKYDEEILEREEELYKEQESTGNVSNQQKSGKTYSYQNANKQNQINNMLLYDDIIQNDRTSNNETFREENKGSKEERQITNRQNKYLSKFQGTGLEKFVNEDNKRREGDNLRQEIARCKPEVKVLRTFIRREITGYQLHIVTTSKEEEAAINTEWKGDAFLNGIQLVEQKKKLFVKIMNVPIQIEFKEKEIPKELADYGIITIRRLTRRVDDKEVPINALKAEMATDRLY